MVFGLEARPSAGPSGCAANSRASSHAQNRPSNDTCSPWSNRATIWTDSANREYPKVRDLIERDRSMRQTEQMTYDLLWTDAPITTRLAT